MALLKLKNIGQIVEANISLGDLTIFVGPQATGKSIALQTLKLLTDTGFVQNELNTYGLDWSKDPDNFFDIYYGEGMHSIWKNGQSSIHWGGKEINLANLVKRARSVHGETVFFIPAQRVLALRDGWPRPFTDYASGDPFAVREFSEKLRRLVDTEFKTTEGSLFPQPRRLKVEFRNLLKKDIFSGFDLKVDKLHSQKRLVLGKKDGEHLPFMVWSAGQREFIPLLLGLYWLMPSTKVSTKQDIKWVVIEELEMGLHPRGISTVLLLVLELLHRGYKVLLSTHSPQVLDMAWAIKKLQVGNAVPSELLKIFNVKYSQSLGKVAESISKKTINVHYFNREGIVKDISSLDPSADDDSESLWGGLAEFSARANEVVSKLV
ncbi:MAG: ATP-binding protein [Nitrospinae bacterium]|nr:ATP-binding protein [Nitrospinota bacterium]